MKLFALGLFIVVLAVLAVIAQAPDVLAAPLFAGFIVLCFIIGLWRRAHPAQPVQPAQWGPPTP